MKKEKKARTLKKKIKQETLDQVSIETVDEKVPKKRGRKPKSQLFEPKEQIEQIKKEEVVLSKKAKIFKKKTPEKPSVPPTVETVQKVPKKRGRKPKLVKEKVEKPIIVEKKPSVIEKEKISIESPPVVEKKPSVIEKEKISIESPPVVEKPKIPPEKIIKINELSTVRDLSKKLKLFSPAELIKKFLSMGLTVSINQRLDPDSASLIAHEYGYEIEFVPLYGEEAIEIKDDISKLKQRAPVVTVMGHVDHGKTSLLDAIRLTNVISTESGGITQHIGAYKVKTHRGEIVFLDTPGHEAFTSMRARGAKVTDIVVLVVAADDGVMPQTVEAIDHARASAVPIIVAINKIDLSTANPQKVKQELSAKYNLIPDEWGGDTFMVEISSRNKTNIDKLLETIIFKADLMELKANPDTLAQGIVIEARLDAKKGPLATVLISRGTLKIGDVFICGLSYGKVKAMITDKLEKILSASVITPVEILGFNSVPYAGDKIIVVENERIARDIVSRREELIRYEKMHLHRHISLSDLSTGKLKQLNIILKADVQGSLEALRDTLDRININEVKLNIVHTGVGTITLNDVNLAILSDSLIIGFNIRPDPNAELLAKKEGIDIRIYRIIYELIDEIKNAMEGMLEPKYEEIVSGMSAVKKIFNIKKVGTIVGCMVVEGKLERSAKVRLLRDNVIIYDGNIASLRRFKEDVREVEKGYECGIMLENFNDIKIDDKIEAYTKKVIKPVTS